MGLFELDIIDHIARTDEGNPHLVMMATHWDIRVESLLTVALMIKVARYLVSEQANQGPGAPTFELVSSEQPPAPVVRWLEKLDILTTVDQAPATGRESPLPWKDNGHPNLNAMQQLNADLFARMHDLPRPASKEALSQVDEVLIVRRAREGFSDDEPSPDLADGALQILAAAYVGEALHEAGYQADWLFEPTVRGMVPVFLRLGGPEKNVRLNLIGKAGKFLRNGSGDSLSAIAVVGASRA
ncbi:MAG: hypothetical protein AAGA48_00830 [Myxococcota bacterium]